MRTIFQFSKKNLILGIILGTLAVIVNMLVGGSIKASLFFVGIFVFLSSVKVTLKNKWLYIYYLLWCPFSAYVLFVSCQILSEQSFSMLGLSKIMLNMLCIFLVFIILLVITMRVRLAFQLSCIFLMLICTINYYVYIFRGSELAPIDIFSLGTALNVFNEYKFGVTVGMVYAWIIVGIWIFGSFCVNEVHLKRSIISYLGVVFLEGVLVVSLLYGTKTLYARHWGMDGTATNGFTLNFVLGFNEIVIEKPNSYDIRKVKEYETLYENNVESRRTPHIIIIMDESFADCSVLGNKINSNRDITPYINSMKENVIKGFALTSVYGGNTPNSEYEFLTGNTCGFLPRGSIPYQQYIKEEVYSLVSVMQGQGYINVAVHPCNATGWSRETVYPVIGFENSYFIDDFDQNNLMRYFVSDQEMFDRIIDEYEKLNEDDKLFLFGVTMQNHGGYEYEGENFEQEIELKGYSQEYPKAEQYLSVIHETDKAVENLITYFDSVDEDVVILFYGDHFPKLEEAFYEEVHGGDFDTLDEKQLKYKVPFFIWTNYDIEEQYVECTSLNYLSNYLYEVAGMEMPAYNLFLKDLQEVIPAMNANGFYSSDNGKFMTYDEAEGKEAEWLERYRILQYNSIFDEDNRSDVFFPNW